MVPRLCFLPFLQSTLVPRDQRTGHQTLSSQVLTVLSPDAPRKPPKRVICCRRCLKREREGQTDRMREFRPKIILYKGTDFWHHPGLSEQTTKEVEDNCNFGLGLSSLSSPLFFLSLLFCVSSLTTAIASNKFKLLSIHHFLHIFVLIVVSCNNRAGKWRKDALSSRHLCPPVKTKKARKGQPLYLLSTVHLNTPHIWWWRGDAPLMFGKTAQTKVTTRISVPRVLFEVMMV